MTTNKTIPLDFLGYRNAFRLAMQKTLKESQPRSLDEAAFPAYSHPNRIINWIYWQRVKTVMNEILKRDNIQNVMDYGCGSGVLLPFLAVHANKVTGVDLDLAPIEKMKRQIEFPQNILFLDLRDQSLADLQDQSFDLITALNVLEHIDDPSSIVDDFFRLLKPGGELIVSLPKENRIYGIARKLAGKEFTGEYHATNYKKVENLCKEKGELIYLLNGSVFRHVFHIFKVEKR